MNLRLYAILLKMLLKLISSFTSDGKDVKDMIGTLSHLRQNDQWAVYF